MKNTKLTSAYLEECHLKYLALTCTHKRITKSEFLRKLIEHDMEHNQEFVKQYEKIIFNSNSSF